VGVDDDRLAVVDVRLVALQPVGAGALEAVCSQLAFAVEHADLVHHLLDGAAELPAMIRRVVVMRRNEDVVAVVLRRLQELLDVTDRSVRLDARAHQAPRRPLRAQEVVLWVGDNDRRIFCVELHFGALLLFACLGLVVGLA
jgi:hypothetical protein